MSAPLRLFVAYWPSATVAQQLAQWVCTLDGVGGRRVPAARLHLTVAFLGDLDAAVVPALQQLLQQVHSLEMDWQLDSLGRFRRSDVVWAGASTAAPALCGAAESLRQALRSGGYFAEEKAFVPHVTLLRGVRGEPLLPAPPAPVIWRIGRPQLVQSRFHAHGVSYQRWPLGEK